MDFTTGLCAVSLVLIAKTTGKFSDKSVFMMADLKSLWPVTLLVIMWSMAFPECLIYLVDH